LLHQEITMASMHAATTGPRLLSTMSTTSLRNAALAALLGSLVGAAQASCGSAFCSINTDWGAGTTGLAEGNTFDLRYEDILQDQPRAGARKVAVGEIPHHHDEVRTRNRNLLGTYTRTLESGWGVAVTLPLADRDHVHIHNHHGEQIPEQWDFREVGDVRVMGRYQRALDGSDTAPRTAGVFFGLKLPTGRTNVANGQGDVAERSLQPGTGTTDLILGTFFHQQIAATGAAWFAQAQLQHALDTHDGFRPGAQAAADVGYAHPFTPRFSGLVQLNTVWKGHDTGTQAEPQDSGGRFAFLSPGLSYKIGESLLLYSYYQQPIYQDVNGVQLTARRAVVVGLSTHF
jgi:hypothetical protein